MMLPGGKGRAALGSLEEEEGVGESCMHEREEGRLIVALIRQGGGDGRWGLAQGRAEGRPAQWR